MSDRRARRASTAASELERLIDEASGDVQPLSNECGDQLGTLLARAWIDGAKAGEEELIREARAQGVEVQQEPTTPMPNHTCPATCRKEEAE